VEWSGDASVAQARGEKRAPEWGEGDAQHKASPLHTSATPAPTGKRGFFLLNLTPMGSRHFFPGEIQAWAIDALRDRAEEIES
jgi:hypothetical protein